MPPLGAALRQHRPEHVRSPDRFHGWSRAGKLCRRTALPSLETTHDGVWNSRTGHRNLLRVSALGVQRGQSHRSVLSRALRRNRRRYRAQHRPLFDLLHSAFDPDDVHGRDPARAVAVPRPLARLPGKNGRRALRCQHLRSGARCGVDRFRAASVIRQSAFKRAGRRDEFDPRFARRDLRNEGDRARAHGRPRSRIEPRIRRRTRCRDAPGQQPAADLPARIEARDLHLWPDRLRRADHANRLEPRAQSRDGQLLLRLQFDRLRLHFGPEFRRRLGFARGGENARSAGAAGQSTDRHRAGQHRADGASGHRSQTESADRGVGQGMGLELAAFSTGRGYWPADHRADISDGRDHAVDDAGCGQNRRRARPHRRHDLRGQHSRLDSGQFFRRAGHLAVA